MSGDKVALGEAFAALAEPWRPRVVARLNGQEVKVARLEGPFVWHHHADADELFMVWRGSLEMQFRDRVVVMSPGDLIVVPRGVEHQPYAPEETEDVLFEPATTLNTGNVRNERTRETLKRIS